MPPCKPVPLLKNIAKDCTLYNVCSVIIDEIMFSEDEEWEVFGPPVLSERLQIVRDILGNSLVPSIMQDILNTILEKDESIQETVRYIAIQLFLVEGVKSLTVGNFPESFYTPVLEAIGFSAAVLERLDLRGLWVGADHKFHLCRALRRLINIKFLTIRYNCDDEILGIIGKYCPNLTKLDISGSSRVTEEGFRKLYDNQRNNIASQLQVLDIGGPGAENISPGHISTLLRHLPNLLSLGSYEKTGQALDVIYKSNPSVQFSLKYLHDLFTSCERILSITKTCPQLQALYLDSPKGAVVQNLDILRNLSEIKINKVKWEDLEVLLKKSGKKIRSLFLLSVFGQIDLLEIGRLCPNLIRLELHRSSLICSGTSHNTAFKSLKEVFIYTSEICALCVKLLMNQGINIKHMALGKCGQLTDAAVISCIMDHSLRDVEALWFGQAENLTMRSVNAFMEHCPKLMSLGNLASWNIAQEEVEILRMQLHATNTDLVLHHIGPEDEENRDGIIFIIGEL